MTSKKLFVYALSCALGAATTAAIYHMLHIWFGLGVVIESLMDLGLYVLPFMFLLYLALNTAVLNKPRTHFSWITHFLSGIIVGLFTAVVISVVIFVFQALVGHGPTLTTFFVDFRNFLALSLGFSAGTRIFIDHFFYDFSE